MCIITSPKGLDKIGNYKLLSKYVYKNSFKKLLRTKQCKNKSEACKYEYEIKKLPRNQKLDWFD